MSMSEDSKIITVKLRVSPDLRDRIAESAKAHNRSMNADMVARLEASFTHEAPDQFMPQLEAALKSVLEGIVKQGVPPQVIVKAIDDSGVIGKK